MKPGSTLRLHTFNLLVFVSSVLSLSAQYSNYEGDNTPRKRQLVDPSIANGLSETKSPVITPISFSLRTVNLKTILAEWKPLSGTAGNDFILERSYDGKYFHSVAKVKSTEHPSNEVKYAFLDTETEPGIYYYRLIQLDQQGNYIYSDAKNIEIPGSKRKVIPDVMDDFLRAIEELNIPKGSCAPQIQPESNKSRFE